MSSLLQNIIKKDDENVDELKSSLKSLNSKITKKLNFAPSSSTSDAETASRGKYRNSSSNNRYSEADDESFYDAIDDESDNNVFDTTSGVNVLPVAAKHISNGHSTTKRDDDDDDDDEECYFFDTKTSRHASEINNDCNSKKKNSITTNTTIPIIVNEYDDDKTKTNEANKSNLENLDEDEEDAELETAWTFWIDKCARGDYEAGIKLIHTVKTVQQFWSVFNNIPDITALPNRYSYHLMRNTRRPMWEDAENCQGGQWKLKCNKNDTSLVWRELVLAGIGEQLSDCVSWPQDDIVGLTVGKREKEDIIQIWNLNHKCEKEATVCDRLKQLVPDVKFSVVFYKPFEGEQDQQSTSNSNKYTQNNRNNNAPLNMNGIGHMMNGNKYNYYNNNNNNINNNNNNYKSTFKQ